MPCSKVLAQGGMIALASWAPRIRVEGEVVAEQCVLARGQVLWVYQHCPVTCVVE